MLRSISLNTAHAHVPIITIGSVAALLSMTLVILGYSCWLPEEALAHSPFPEMPLPFRVSESIILSLSAGVVPPVSELRNQECER